MRKLKIYLETTIFNFYFADDAPEKMTNEPRALREIHEIRLANYERTKNMTPAERISQLRESVMPIIKQYNLRVCPLPND